MRRRHYAVRGGVTCKLTLVYPDWYAGAYLDDDLRAVVVVVDANPDIIRLIQSITQNERVSIKEGRNSFNQMLGAIRILLEFEKYPFSYVTRLSEANNVVVVTIDETLDEAAKSAAVAMITCDIQSDVLMFEFGSTRITPH